MKNFTLLKKFWLIVGGGILTVFLFFFLLGLGLFGALPDIEELENPKSALSSEIFSDDGVILGKYYLQNRSNVTFKELSPNLVNALIATEDIRFKQHSGIDFKATVRAVVRMGRDGGASTITQQLAKNLFSDKPKSKIQRLLQKCKEWIIAIRLERRYTKDEIVSMYFNTVQYSGAAYGIKAAAKEFFNKSPKELDINESAMLVGMLKGISMYNPERNPKNALSRRNVVLKQMEIAKMLTPEEYNTQSKKEIVLNYHPEDHNEGPAPYFREFLRQELDKWCREHGYDIYKDGLRIYTTIDSRLQRYAEEAVAKHMAELQKTFFTSWGKREPWRKLDWTVIPDYLDKEMKKTERYRVLKESGLSFDEIKKSFKQKIKMKVYTMKGARDTVLSPWDSIAYAKHFLHCGFVAIDPHNAEVRAWVGDFNHEFFKFDHVHKGFKRQIGSTFKPIVYGAAIDINQTSPCTTFPNEPITIGGWTPRDAHKAGGNYNMYQGLARSNNYITARIMASLGPTAPQIVVDFAERMGIEKGKIDPVWSICLGSHELSPYEMAGAFTTFVNKGLWAEPIFVTRIEDKNGNVLEDFTAKRKYDQVFSEEKAYIVYKMMRGVINHGTGSRIFRYGITQPVAGKTGTTNGNADGWFMGVTTDLVTATWVGGEDPSVRFPNTNFGQGANSALPIFAYFIQKAFADKELALSQLEIDPPKERLIQWECDDYAPTGVSGDADLDLLE